MLSISITKVFIVFLYYSLHNTKKRLCDHNAGGNASTTSIFCCLLIALVYCPLPLPPSPRCIDDVFKHEEGKEGEAEEGNKVALDGNEQV